MLHLKQDNLPPIKTLLLGIIVSLVGTSECYAEFALNFEPVADKYQPVETHWGIGPPLDYWKYYDEWSGKDTPDYPLDDRPTRWDDRYTRWTNYSNLSFGEAGVRLFGQSPFLMQYWIGGIETPELVTDPSNGKPYWHILVVDPFNDFKQEVFIEAVYGVKYGETALKQPLNHSSSFITEDKVYGYYDIPGSASSGGTNDYQLVGGSQYAKGNQSRIFSKDAGNGTGDPRRVLIRQVVGDGDIKMEFLKDHYDKKPLITQKVKDAGIDSYFELDMRELNYETLNTPGKMINTLKLIGSDTPGETGNFDSTQDRYVQNMNVTGGMFIYNPDTGPTGPADAPESGGTYTYATGEFNHYDIKWANYLDPATFTGGYAEYVNKDGETVVEYLQGVSLEDRIDIKGNGWEFQGWGADVWWKQKTDETSTYQEGVKYVNPWSFSQEDFCDYADCK